MYIIFIIYIEVIICSWKGQGIGEGGRQNEQVCVCVCVCGERSLACGWDRYCGRKVEREGGGCTWDSNKDVSVCVRVFV